ncbi:PerC family transcriptional regulator [Escherichia coli]|uniref:PerC family transcriptional regulator n=1 Tax=Escherichia coli TaxID=562 RepID=UPI00287A89F2|nr:PerC family transcriptional regulator [Escherichia coli]MDS1617151.1 PerC family transcriptional regulator [Escherichia coli]
MTDITKRMNSVTIHDEKAEALEAKGFYRRAATRWGEVMMLVDGDKERERAAQRRAECIRKAARPRVMMGNFGVLKEAVNRTHAGMGMKDAGKSSWRNYPKQQ